MSSLFFVNEDYKDLCGCGKVVMGTRSFARPTKQRLGLTLLLIRRRYGMSRQEFAKLIGMSMTHLTAIEVGRLRISTGEFDRIVALLGLVIETESELASESSKSPETLLDDGF